MIYRNLIAFLLSTSGLCAQVPGTIYMGSYSPDTTGRFGIMTMDFRGDAFGVYRDTEVEMQFTLGSQAYWWNQDGSARLISNGSWITNTRGDTISGLLEKNRNIEQFSVDWSGYTSQHNGVFLKKPGSEDSVYYIYGDARINMQQRVSGQNVLYAEIKLSEDGLSDELLYSGRIAYTDPELYHDQGQFLPIQHANGNDWWIWRHRTGTNIFDMILLDEDGFHYSHSFTTETSFSGNLNINGLSWDMKHLYVTESGPFAEDPTNLIVFDIDRCTGKFKETHSIQVLPNSVTGSPAAVSSMNNRFLYVTTGEQVFQYDTQASDLKASEFEVARFEGETCSIRPDVNDYLGFNHPFRGPDGKIYVFDRYSCTEYTVIQNPERKGEACNIEKWAYNTPAITNAVLPNIINLNIGPLPEGECNITTNDDEPDEGAPLQIFPNPSTNDIFVNLPEGLQNISVQFNILNAQGQIMDTGQRLSSAQESFNVSAYPEGIYWITVQNREGHRARASFLKLER